MNNLSFPDRLEQLSEKIVRFLCNRKELVRIMRHEEIQIINNPDSKISQEWFAKQGLFIKKLANMFPKDQLRTQIDLDTLAKLLFELLQKYADTLDGKEENETNCASIVDIFLNGICPVCNTTEQIPVKSWIWKIG